MMTNFDLWKTALLDGEEAFSYFLYQTLGDGACNICPAMNETDGFSKYECSTNFVENCPKLLYQYLKNPVDWGND